MACASAKRVQRVLISNRKRDSSSNKDDKPRKGGASMAKKLKVAKAYVAKSEQRSVESQVEDSGANDYD